MGRFILLRGILEFGTFTFLIGLGENLLFEHRKIDLHFLVLKVLQWGIAGVFFGWIIWRVEFDPDEEEG